MSICQLCDQWVEQLQAFLLTLETEFDALQSNQPDLITQVAELKMIQINQIDHIERQLHAELPQLSSHQILSHIKNACQSHSADGLVSLSKTIHQLNQRNGMLLQTLVRLNEFGLNLLSGKIESSEVYGASGQVKSVTPLSNITLATA
jgi:flagellar biosynthesis/type III secretory pathway chaperone